MQKRTRLTKVLKRDQEDSIGERWEKGQRWSVEAQRRFTLLRQRDPCVPTQLLLTRNMLGLRKLPLSMGYNQSSPELPSDKEQASFSPTPCSWLW